MTISLRLRLETAAAVYLALLTSAATPGSAATVGAAAVTFQVNTPNDGAANFANDPGFTVCHTGPANTTCTLRAAIMNANRHGGGATIQLPSGTYLIQVPPSGPGDDASGDLNLSSTVTIAGAGADSTIVDGGALDGVFFINPSAVVTMTGLTIRDGNNHNFLLGGGIFDEGRLSLSKSVVSDNFASLLGGGLFINTGGTASLDRVTVTGNRNGGIDNDGSLTITNSSLYANFAASRDGGAIRNEEGSHLMVFNSTLSNNSTGGDGGALKNSGTATILASTIAGNLADDQALGLHSGGGIFNDGDGSLQLTDTLLADNFASHTVSDCSGPITSQDYNLILSTLGCAITGLTTHNVIDLGADRRLASLADHGGGTLTRALLAGSPALDRIPAALCRDPFGTAPAPDQRGVARPVNGLCDIGAYEGAQPTPLFGRNLVFDGDAEANAGSPSGAWVGVPGWTASGQFSVVPYNATGGFPSVPTDTVPASRGANFFAGGSVATSQGFQQFDLSPAAGLIDAGAVRFVLAGDLGGFLDQADNAKVTVGFFDHASHFLAENAIGPVSAADRGNRTGLWPRTVSGDVPAGARIASLNVTLTRVSGVGPYNDGYADNISLVLVPKYALFLPALYQ